MFSRNSLILLSACAVVGISILLAVLQVLPGSTGTGYGTPFSFGISESAGTGSFAKDLPTFSSGEEVRQFLMNHTDTNSLYPVVSGTVAGEYFSTGEKKVKQVRTWSFTVDLTRFSPDAYIVKASSPEAGISATALFSLDPGPRPVENTPPTASASARDGQDSTLDFITIDPIPDQYPGDLLVVTGTTNLPPEADIVIDVGSTSFKPTRITGTNGTGSISGIAQSTTRSSDATEIRKFSAAYPAIRGSVKPDIMETKGNLTYVITGNSLDIIRSGPADSAELLSTIKFSGTPIALYGEEGRLLLLANETTPREQWLCTPATCSGRADSQERMVLFLYSVADPKHPELQRTVSVAGSYQASFVSNGFFYFATESPLINLSTGVILPDVMDSEEGTTTPVVYYVDRNDQAFFYTTCGALDLGTNDPVNAKTFLVGTSGAALLTPTHFYTTSTTPGRNGSGTATDIVAFTLDKGKIAYSGHGSANGTLINEYSMNEYQGNLQVVTEVSGSGMTDSLQGSSGQYTNTYIFDRRMSVIGSLEHIAPGQQTYSPRFTGDRIYLGTGYLFDPYTVINTTDSMPAIAGNLTLPDNSGFFYPYDTTHIITVGMETGTDLYGGTSAGGIRLSMYDISDISDPVLTGKNDLGGQGSSSSIFETPESFYFDRNTSILVLPIHVNSGEETESGNATTLLTGDGESWDGVYVFSVNATGFGQVGMVRQQDASSQSISPVIRSHAGNGTLYTLSQGSLVISRLDTTVTPLKSVLLI
ncbi:MAG: beta-propeller domain-containing protein [Methanoregulaceae archaeon]